MALLKLRVVIGLPAALPPAAEKAFSSPSLSSGRIFPLSFSAGVLPWHWFLPLYFLDSTSGLSVWENQNEAGTGPWKKEIGRSRRAQPYPEISSTAELKRSFLIYQQRTLTELFR
jgi:hypothetical protein